MTGSGRCGLHPRSAAQPHERPGHLPRGGCSRPFQSSRLWRAAAMRDLSRRQASLSPERGQPRSGLLFCPVAAQRLVWPEWCARAYGARGTSRGSLKRLPSAMAFPRQAAWGRGRCCERARERATCRTRCVAPRPRTPLRTRCGTFRRGPAGLPYTTRVAPTAGTFKSSLSSFMPRCMRSLTTSRTGLSRWMTR